MLRKVHFTKSAKVIVALVVLVAAIGFAERKSGDGACVDIVIRIDNQHNNYFIDETDILNLMTDHGGEVIIGSDFRDLNLKSIEERVKKEPFIKEVEIYKDLKGNLLVNTKLRRPFARIMTNDGLNAYIAMDGVVLPMSSKYTTRTVILSGEYMRELAKHNLTDYENGLKIYELLKFIDQDKFWKAQVAQIDIDKKLNVRLYPQVTKQIVEFGQPEEIKKKFKKLQIFYEKILPQKGWNTYERVNLEYKDQIIAE